MPPLVVAGDSGSAWGERVIRRAAQLARAGDAQLLVVHVQIANGLTHPEGQSLDRHRQLTAELGGTYTEITGSAPALVLADTARARGAATVVVGHHRSRLGSSPTARYPPGCAACSPERLSRRYVTPNPRHVLER